MSLQTRGLPYTERESRALVSFRASRRGWHTRSHTMDSHFEVVRQTHEEVERFERALYDVLARPTGVHQTRLQNEHKASQILDRLAGRYTVLNTLYNDDSARSAEKSALAAPASHQQGDLAAFYSRLGKLQDHHHKYPDAGADGFDLELAAFLDEPAPEEYDDGYEPDDRA